MSVISTSASAVSQSVRDAFSFSVDKFPLFGPENLKTDQYGLFRSDSGYIPGIKSVSKNYVPHTTDDVCALVEAASEAFDGEVECKTHWQAGHYVNIQPTKADRLRVFGEADNVWPRVIIRAGYDGQAFTGSMGYYRDACRNLSILRQVSGTSVKIRHSGGLRGAMDDLIAAFNTLKDGWDALANAVLRMQSREVRITDFLDKIYGRPTPEQLALAASGKNVRAVTVHENRTRAIWDRLNRERELTGRPVLTDTVSAWEAYNAIQGYVQHDAQAKSGFKSEMARIIRAYNDSDVRLAEKLALAA